MPPSSRRQRRHGRRRFLQQLALGSLILVIALFAIGYHERIIYLSPAEKLLILAPIPNDANVVPVQLLRNGYESDDPYKIPPHPLYYIIPTPELTTWIVGNYSQESSSAYAEALNEARAEIWLHRAFEQQLPLSQYRTWDPTKANVFVIAGYFHLRERLMKLQILRPEHGMLLSSNDKKNEWIDNFLAHRIIDKRRPHLMLVPTWNPTVSRKIGLHPLMKAMVRRNFSIWSVGYERNPAWQSTPFERIIPIPYVVDPPWSRDQMMKMTSTTVERKENFVFYAGDSRPNAIEWAGCHRVRMLSPLVNLSANNNNSNMDVRIVTKHNRLSQSEYNDRMATSDYCLILCGDTPSSRSLTSAMVYGCIPVRIGSRLRGLCEPPCKVGFGFRRTGTKYPHLPYSNAMDWNLFPELDEAEFTQKPLTTVQAMLHRIGPEEKKRLRSIMRKVQMGWIYGWGDPVTSNEFGNVSWFIWESFVDGLRPN